MQVKKTEKVQGTAPLGTDCVNEVCYDIIGTT